MEALEWNRKYRLENVELYRGYRQKYRISHPEKIKQTIMVYCQSGASERKLKEYRPANPEKVKKWNWQISSRIKDIVALIIKNTEKRYWPNNRKGGKLFGESD